jgi:2-polyprenyl-6-hydroxyphenyl methylase / 3-demethylubiquinone-9 3-methyltransferase
VTAQIDNNVYNRLADTWWDENGLLNILKAMVNPWRVPYFQRILTELQIDPSGKRALDVGCGGGLLAEEFAAMGFAVTGIDPSEASLAAARAHAAASGMRIDYRPGSGDELPFENETFDVVYCCDVLEHIPNWDAVIGEISRVLKQNGIFFYDTVNRTTFSKIVVIKMAQEWNFTRFFPPNVHVWEMFIKPEELIASLERHGLRNQDARGTKLGNPVRMISAMRQYRTGKISGSEFGRRLGFREGSNMAGSYMGYALKWKEASAE